MLIETINPDTLKKDNSNNDSLTKDEKETSYGRDKNDWKKYLEKNLDGSVADYSINGGQVTIRYIIDTTGKCSNVVLTKSVEFVLDEEAKRIIYISPLWNPAYQKGRKVKAYRNQPITFAKPE